MPLMVSYSMHDETLQLITGPKREIEALCCELLQNDCAGLIDRKAIGGKEIRPVYRTSPYRAEAERLAGASSIAQILFIDEGQQCRCLDSASTVLDLRPLSFCSQDWTVAR